LTAAAIACGGAVKTALGEPARNRPRSMLSPLGLAVGAFVFADGVMRIMGIFRSAGGS